MSGFRDRGIRSRKRRVQALLQPIDELARANEARADDIAEVGRRSQGASEAVRSAIESSTRLVVRFVVGVMALVLVLASIAAYQTLLLSRLGHQVESATDRLKKLSERNDLLEEQNEVLRGQLTLSKLRGQLIAKQNQVLRKQVELTEAQNDRLAEHSRLMQTQLKRLAVLNRRLGIEAKRAAVATLSNERPCSQERAEPATMVDGLCPASSVRARHEALFAYLRSAPRADLSNTRLDHLSLVNANLRNANLTGAMLRDVSLRDADVRGANFGASRELQRPSRWCFDDETIFPPGFDPGTSDPGACASSSELHGS